MQAFLNIVKEKKKQSVSVKPNVQRERQVFTACSGSGCSFRDSSDLNPHETGRDKLPLAGGHEFLELWCHRNLSSCVAGCHLDG
jgi:hypothetical protein